MLTGQIKKKKKKKPASGFFVFLHIRIVNQHEEKKQVADYQGCLEEHV